MMTDKLADSYENTIKKFTPLDGLAPLFFRLILGPVMIIAGYNKLGFSIPDASFVEMFLADPNVVAWFGNEEWGLGLPVPGLMAFLAGWAEFLGGWFILVGFMTRFAAIPLMVTMIVAATAVHWDNGWFAVAPSDSSTSAAVVYDWLGMEAAKESLENSEEVGIRLSKMKEILADNGNTNWLFGRGNIVVLNNGIEFSAIYFVMLLSLFFTGGGRFTSVDFYLKNSVFK